MPSTADLTSFQSDNPGITFWLWIRYWKLGPLSTKIPFPDPLQIATLASKGPNASPS